MKILDSNENRKRLLIISLLTTILLIGIVIPLAEALNEYGTIYIYHNNETEKFNVNLNQGDKLYFTFQASNAMVTTSAVDPFGNTVMQPVLGSNSGPSGYEYEIDAQNTGVYSIIFTRGDSLNPDGTTLTATTIISLNYGISPYSTPNLTIPNNGNSTPSDSSNYTTIYIIIGILVIILIPIAIILSRRVRTSRAKL